MGKNSNFLGLDTIEGNTTHIGYEMAPISHKQKQKRRGVHRKTSHRWENLFIISFQFFYFSNLY